MLKFIITLLMAGLLVWASIKIAITPGFVIFAYEHWTMEMPLWFFLSAAFAILLAFYLLLALLRGTRRFTKHLKLLKQQHKLAIAHRKTSQGLLALAEGDWSLAEKQLTQGIEYSSQPLINYLAAARAAHEQMAYERRDRYLEKAHLAIPEASIAAELTQAELQISHHQLEHAVATLRHLQSKAPKHPYVLKRLYPLYISLEDWQGLLELLPHLVKYKVLKSEEAKNLEIEAFCGLFNKVNGLQLTVDKVWDDVPKSLRREKKLVIPYVRHLLQEKDYLTAEATLRDVLKYAWDSELVTLYGETKSSDPHKQLVTAEGWLKSHGNSPALLLCLAQLATRNQLWGQAKEYLQTSLSIMPSFEAYALLAFLHEQLGEVNEALKAYQKAVQLKER